MFAPCLIATFRAGRDTIYGVSLSEDTGLPLAYYYLRRHDMSCLYHIHEKMNTRLLFEEAARFEAFSAAKSSEIICNTIYERFDCFEITCEG